jgi:hypothetical protein
MAAPERFGAAACVRGAFPRRARHIDSTAPNDFFARASRGENVFTDSIPSKNFFKNLLSRS